MRSTNIPVKFQIPWGNSAGSAYIRKPPVGSQISIQGGAASFTDGFPPLTMTPVISGGIPPFGQDMNGILQDITVWNQWQQAGGAVPYDSVFQSEIGGYPLGSIVTSVTNSGIFWQNTIEANTTNPDAGGVGWSTFASVASFDTFAQAQAATVLAGNNYIRTLGYYALGDYGATLYKRVTSGTFQLTTADGATWAVAGPTFLPQMFGAKGDGSHDDTVAIQNAINYLSTTNLSVNLTSGGAVLFFPPGNYLTQSGITIKGGMRLIGSGRFQTQIQSKVFDLAATITFDSSCSYALLEGFFVLGFQNAAAGGNTINVANNVPVIIRDCNIWGGQAGLNTTGVDGFIENCFIAGYTNCITSGGANWYIRCKIDTAGLGTPTNGVLIGTYFTSGVSENHFVDCDFSGNFTNSITINDAGQNSALNTFVGCVISSPIVITNAKISMFSACEVGGAVTVGSNPSLFTGCASTAGSTVISGGGKVVSGCYNLS